MELSCQVRVEPSDAPQCPNSSGERVLKGSVGSAREQASSQSVDVREWPFRVCLESTASAAKSPVKRWPRANVLSSAKGISNSGFCLDTQIYTEPTLLAHANMRGWGCGP